MNRALRIILPILLIVVILISVGWYLLKYDPAFTQELLINQARRAEDRGDLSLSTWLYSMAYRQSGNDEAVAIELAAQYRSIGNFTKAEYTLSHAIADGGSMELYLALCQTYIQQDKLLDAVTMLDNVADPTVKAQLDAIRPAAPTASPGAGYHNEYISVSLSAQDGTVYYTTDGSYPSAGGTAYSQPFSLSGGETTVYTLTLGDNGLISPLAIYSYTVAGVIEPVELTDPAIDQSVRQMLQVGSDYVLYSNDLWTITSLIVPAEAESIEDLKWMPYLKQLVMRGNTLESLAPLGSLRELEELIVTKQELSSEDLSTIAALPKLTTLTLSQCSLSGINPLSGATAITRLDLSDNTISDLTALSHMPELSYLDISKNAVGSLRALYGKQKLTELYASYNSITSTDGLSACTALTVLDLNNNALTTLSGLENLTSLRNLYASTNQLTDVSVLAANPLLGDLDISHNALTDISALNSLEQLLLLDFSYNQVTQFPAFPKNHGLISINGSNNLLTSLELLRGLSSLNTVNVEQNAGITSVLPLADCPLLVQVNVLYTGVTDVSSLTDNNRNVIVKYSPIGM